MTCRSIYRHPDFNMKAYKCFCYVLVTVTVLISFTFALAPTTPCQNAEICQCSTHLAICDGVSYIPVFQNQIKAVLVKNSNLRNITSKKLSNLTLLHLTYLKFQNNSLVDIARDAFVNLPCINKLEITDENKIRPNVVRDFLFEVSRSITELTIRNFNWTSLGNEFPGDMFLGLNSSNIKHLTLHHNNMSVFKGTWFKSVHTLTSLDLTQNFLSENWTDFSELKNLTILNMGMNSYKTLPDFCPGRLPSLKMLDMRNNKLTDVIRLKKHLGCLENLQTLILNGHSIRIIYNSTFSSLKSLQTLHLSEICQIFRLAGNAFASKTLEKLIFSSNGFHFKRNSFQAKEIFRGLPNLKTLDISGNHLLISNHDMQQMLKPLKQLENLYMANVAMWYLPNNLTLLLPKLVTLNVSNNLFSTFDGEKIFGNRPTLRYLNFARNHISIVNQTTFPENLLDSLLWLNFSYNPLSCSCNDVFWFFQWLMKAGHRGKLANVNNLKCQSPDYLKDKTLISLTTGDICPLSTETKNLIIGLTITSAFLLITIIILYKSRWHIRHWLYIVRSNRRSGYTRIMSEDDYVYDGFLVYAEEDRVFVHDVLLPRLEKQEGFRMCVHFRDFDVGKFIADNIVDSMNKSRKIVIILSNSFAKSNWCDFELMIAQNRVISEERDLMTLILYKEIDFRHMTSKLRIIMTTMTYAKWSHDSTGQQLFWNQLLQGLRRPTFSRANHHVE